LSTERGVVAEFDADKGFGSVEAEDGRRLFFHCTQIAGGTRTIDVGTPVTFDIVAGHLGRYEAVAVTPKS
jgi:CspA family cold shock protein